MNQSNGYTKLDKEDPEDVTHRRAQFLIYKVMQQVDKSQRKNQQPLFATTSFIRVRLCRLKVKIGRKLRKGVLVSVSAARLRIYKKLRIQWKRLFGRPAGSTSIAGAAVGLPASIFPSM
ncbi:hypothetical protein LINPERPRIM_LOCUS43940 [Linum perenne]